MSKVHRAVVTTLSGPLRRLSRTNAPATNAPYRSVCGHGRLTRAQTEKCANGLFSGENGGFQAQFYPDRLVLIPTKRSAEQSAEQRERLCRFRQRRYQNRVSRILPTRFAPFGGFIGLSAFCAVPAASVRFSVDSPRFQAFCSGFPRTSPAFCAVPGFRG